jgi:protein TonB
MTYTEEDKSDRTLPLAITIGVHGLIFLLLFLYIIHTPLPPFPEPGGGVEIALGTMDVGMGDDDLNPPANVKNGSQAKASPEDNDVVTNDAENSSALPKNNKVKDKTNTKPVDKPKDNPVPKPDDALTQMLKNYNAKASKQGGHGDDDKPGFKGDPNGTPGSKNYTGTPGDGGTGPGQGPGSGPGAHLSHRHLVVPATLVSNEQEEGIVVVNITVDKDGNVIDAESRAKGSTTTSSVLWAKARQAALKAKFDKSPDGTPEQHGTYVFRFSFK